MVYLAAQIHIAMDNSASENFVDERETVQTDWAGKDTKGRHQWIRDHLYYHE